MQAPTLGDSYIACPFQIQMRDQQGGISLGTAFFYEHDGDTFIITNWHNVAGKHPRTGEPLHEYRSPLFIAAKWPVVNSYIESPRDTKYIHFQIQPVLIEGDDGPLWFEHPELGSMCDVVAIPFRRPNDWPAVAHKAANRIEDGLIPVDPGMRVVVIGFPLGLSSGPGLPMLKAGCLSSIPGYDIRLGGEFSEVGGMQGGISVPAVLLDVHTIPGMSGSPVFAEYSGFWNPADPLAMGITRDSVIGTGRMFLGCYSSRVSGLEERSGLGLCFWEDVIKEVCQAKFPGRRFVRDRSE